VTGQITVSNRSARLGESEGSSVLPSGRWRSGLLELADYALRRWIVVDPPSAPDGSSNSLGYSIRHGLLVSPRAASGASGPAAGGAAVEPLFIYPQELLASASHAERGDRCFPSITAAGAGRLRGTRPWDVPSGVRPDGFGVARTKGLEGRGWVLA
jgi:hypothetical protein